VHGDLSGPIRLATHGGRWYFLLLTTKDQAAEAIKEIKARAKAKTGKRLWVLWTDRGREFTSLEFDQYCRRRVWDTTSRCHIHHSRMA